MTDRTLQNKHHAKFPPLSITRYSQEDSHPVHDLLDDQILGQNKDDMENPERSIILSIKEESMFKPHIKYMHNQSKNYYHERYLF